MKVRALCILNLLCLIWICTACSSGEQVEPTPQIDEAEEKWQEQGIESYRVELTAQIDEAEGKWQEQGIESYRIEVLSASIWHAQSHQITVRNGKVVEESASCIPAPTESGKCEVEPFNAEDYTVPGLFSRAWSQAQIEQGQWTRITFDPTYGFPSQVSFDNPKAVDEESTWRVKTFEVLK